LQIGRAAAKTAAHIEDDAMKITHLLFAAGLTALAATAPAQAAEFSDKQKSEMETIIRNYLLDNPALLREMADKLEANDKKAEEDLRNKALITNKDEVFKKAADPTVGNAKGNVTIVEFMDYNCGWCKKSVGEVQTLLKSDKDIKVIFKDFPIFGEHSEYAARAALAAEKQGKYWELHQAMFAHEGQVTTDVVNQLAEAQGLDLTKLQTDIASKDISERIAANMQLGKELAINGTPAFIIDDQVYGGYLTMDALNAAIDDVRKNGCKMC
jgi:protein-disulfide isomerase